MSLNCCCQILNGHFYKRPDFFPKSRLQILNKCILIDFQKKIKSMKRTFYKQKYLESNSQKIIPNSEKIIPNSEFS